jgi:hypothetical protein
MIEQHHKLEYLRRDLTRNGAPWLSELNRMGPEAIIFLAPLAHLASWIRDVRRDLLDKEKVSILVVGTAFDVIDSGRMWSLLPRMLGRNEGWADITAANTLGGDTCKPIGLVPPSVGKSVRYLGKKTLDDVLKVDTDQFDVVFVTMSEAEYPYFLFAQENSLLPVLRRGGSVVSMSDSPLSTALMCDLAQTLNLSAHARKDRFQVTYDNGDGAPITTQDAVSFTWSADPVSPDREKAVELCEKLCECIETIRELDQLQLPDGDVAAYRHWGAEAACLSSSSPQDTFITLPRGLALRRLSGRFCRIENDLSTGDISPNSVPAHVLESHPGSEAHWIEKTRWACSLWQRGLGAQYGRTILGSVEGAFGVQMTATDLGKGLERLIADSGQPELLQKLKAFAGATPHNPTAKERSLLLLISQRREADVISALESDPQLRYAMSEQSEPLLLLLLREKMMSAFVWLLDHGIDPNKPDASGRTIIVDAGCAANSEPFVKELARRGVDLNSRDVLGWTALLCALVRGNWSVAAALLKAGASARIPNSMGLSAIDVAQGKQTKMSDFPGHESLAAQEEALLASLRNSGALGTNETMPGDLRQAILAAS